MKIHLITSAGSGDANLVVAGKVLVHKVDISNSATANGACVKLHDSATTPTAGVTAVKYPVVVPAATVTGSYAVHPCLFSQGSRAGSMRDGLLFSSGLSYTITTERTQGGSTAVGAGEVVGVILYTELA